MQLFLLNIFRQSMSVIGLSTYTSSASKFCLRVNGLLDASLICSLLGLQTVEFKRYKIVLEQ